MNQPRDTSSSTIHQSAKPQVLATRSHLPTKPPESVWDRWRTLKGPRFVALVPPDAAPTMVCWSTTIRPQSTSSWDH